MNAFYCRANHQPFREAEVLLSQSHSVSEICRQLGVVGAEFYCWRKEYDGLKVNQARRLKDLSRRMHVCAVWYLT